MAGVLCASAGVHCTSIATRGAAVARWLRLSMSSFDRAPPRKGRIAAATDGADLTSLIVAEAPRLRRHALSLLYSRADAEDLLQDCLEAALSKQETLKDRDRLRAWLFSILNNLFLMRLRSQGRRGVPLPIDEFADSLAASVPAADRGEARDLARAMGRLSA